MFICIFIFIFILKTSDLYKSEKKKRNTSTDNTDQVTDERKKSICLHNTDKRDVKDFKEKKKKTFEQNSLRTPGSCNTLSTE